MEQQPMIASIIGPPGGGKSTFARNVISSPEHKEHSAHISLGDEVRKIYTESKVGKSRSLVARDIKEHYESGRHYELLPDDVIRQVAEDALARYIHNQPELMLLDGQPRRISQIHDLQELAEKYNYHLGGAVHVSADLDMELERMISRGIRPGDVDPIPTVANAKKRQEYYQATSLDVPLALIYHHISTYELDSSGPQDRTLRLGSAALTAMRQNLQPRRPRLV